MKFSTILTFMISIEVRMLQSAAQTLVITTDDCSACTVGTYCTNSLQTCHGPPVSGTCFNATISEYQFGCPDGYDCYDNMCECVIDDPYPTTAPTYAPTTAPTYAPTSAPTSAPTAAPTMAPTAAPTMAPTAAPTMAPTAAPTMAPTAAPTMAPTAAPTMAPTAAPTTAPTSAPSPESSGIYTPCPSGTYWEVGATACRGPSYVGECYNPATAKYQNGCAPGFTCINNKCSTIPPATFSPSVCYIKCTESDEYCENGTNTCRGPSYAGECFNVATGRYQNGCGLGYRCANNMCVKA